MTQPNKSSLDMLYAAVEGAAHGVQTGDLAIVRGSGGMEVLGDRHEVFALSESQTQVTGDRNLVVNGDMKVVGDGEQVSPHESNPNAVDSLTVHGDMKSDIHDTMTLGVGRVDRKYHGPHTIITGMEGVICAGPWQRTYASTFTTLAALKQSDVFGGAILGAGLRFHSASLLYRSADRTRWTMGMYSRDVTACLEPSNLSVSPRQGKWANRWNNFQNIAFTILPMVGIMYAMTIGLVLGLFALGKFGYSKLTGKKGPPGKTQRRIRGRRVDGAAVFVRDSEVVI